MGTITKTLGIAAMVLALKGSYHLGRTARDARYNVERHDGAAYLVDTASHQKVKIDESRALHDQRLFCSSQPASQPYAKTLDNYMDTAAKYARRVLE